VEMPGLAACTLSFHSFLPRLMYRCVLLVCTLFNHGLRFHLTCFPCTIDQNFAAASQLATRAARYLTILVCIYWELTPLRLTTDYLLIMMSNKIIQDQAIHTELSKFYYTTDEPPFLSHFRSP
jgi:hypothetical protein